MIPHFSSPPSLRLRSPLLQPLKHWMEWSPLKKHLPPYSTINFCVYSPVTCGHHMPKPPADTNMVKE